MQQEFGDFASNAAIQTLSSNLDEISYSRSGKPDDDDLADYWSDLIENGDPYFTLLSSLNDIEITAKRKRAKSDGRIIHRLLFANVVTSLETYLGDCFGKALSSNRAFLESFVFKSGHFQNVNIKLSEIFNRSKTIDAEVLKHVASHNWHRVGDSAKIYKQAFGVKFPEISKIIHNGIRDRHDIVHRNGKSPDGIEGSWGLAEIVALKGAVSVFATEIEEQIKKLPKPKTDPPDVPIEF